MLNIAIWIAFAIAVSGGCLGEWLRLRRGWAAGIAPCYGHAAVLWALIVAGNAELADIRMVESQSSISPVAIVLVLIGGPILYAVAWVVVVTSWDYFQQTRARLRARRKSGGRP